MEFNKRSALIEILPIELKDLELVSKLVDRAYQTPYKSGGLANHALDTKEKLEQEIGEGTKIFVIKKDGIIMGTDRYLMEENGVCHLNRLAVAPEFRNQGIGKMLVNKTLDEAKREGATSARLECLEEKGLVPYYKSLGFKVMGKEPHHKHTLVSMEKEL